MIGVRSLARPLLATIFVADGVDAVQHPEGRAKQAEKVAQPLARTLGLPEDPTTLVRINGAVQLAAGTMLALGRMPRLASTVLFVSLIPTTVAGHAFWEEDDETSKAVQRIHFMKNLAMMGGLLLAAVDTGGEPSLSWRARRAAGRVTHALPLPLGD
ncbi:MAG: hypothetical protein QOJ19_1141 [Acidimicrobiia bacterium]|jgi:uncharacterized membrane protein YphA (DoxX/SURF4 family)|nr:hypothetical protein [Acidimicrobiia bacterium]